MSDPKKIPDDFSKTTPNMPRADDMESADWEKTNYNAKFAPQPPADDWGKTQANIPPMKNDPRMSSQNPKTPDWGVTEGNIKLPTDDFGGEKQDNFGERTSYGATSPFIRLPDAERAKYQNLPPTPTQKAEKQKEEDKDKKGGIPSWFWATAVLLTLFFVTIISIFAVYFFFIRASGFDLVVLNPQRGSKILVDGIEWSVTEGDGSLIARGLKANELKKIEIKHPNFTCEPREVKGENGETVKIPARCTPNNAGNTDPKQTVDTGLDCKNIKNKDFATAEKCAEQALAGLKEPYSPEDVAAALNLYIINFAVKKFDIPENNMKFLEKASAYLKKLPPTTVIEVGGHTDSDGSDADNQKLSENRAKSVRDALVSKFGVNPNMLTEKGYGETRPKPNNQNRNPDEKFQNRRIEYTVMKK